MKNSLFVLVILLVTTVTFAAGPQGHEIYSLVSIPVPDRATVQTIGKLGIDFEGSSGKVGGTMEFVVSEYDREILTKNGIIYHVIDPDLQKSYEARTQRMPAAATGFGDGSMGGYYTFAEVIHQLDSMHATYPNIVSERVSIGKSVEGRDQWMVRISNHPDTEDTTKTEVLYTGLHHAREPGGMMAVLYYMWWIADHYTTDPRASYLVNNRDMYFIPVVNPDGYEFNRQNAPHGGGGWRKNRADNGNGTYGVDLNRNYGPDNMWNAPNNGSATTPNSDTYRGPSPFSEPETRSIDSLMRAHQFKLALNYHTYGNYLIYPFGCFNHETADSVTYREFTFDMTADNRYQSGTDEETVNYGTRGTSDDYMYGDATKPKTFALTPEASYTFWADQETVVPSAAENLTMNIYASFVSGQYTLCTRTEFTDADGNANGFPDRGESVRLHLTLRNKGLLPAGNLRYTITQPTNDLVIGDSASKVISSVPARSNMFLDIPASVKSDATTGKPVPLIVTLTDEHGYSHADTIMTYLGTPTTLIYDNVDDALPIWIMDGWEMTGDSFSGFASLTDSQFGNYPPNADLTLTTMNYLALSPYDHVQLKFWSKWLMESRMDFDKVEVTTDSGTTWTSLPVTYARHASGAGVQLPGTFGFDGYSPGMDWVESTADLSAFTGKSILLQFSLLSDGSTQKDGWYLDEIRLYGYKENVLGVLDNNLVPRTDRLMPNYPNPFNPTTIVTAELAQAGHLTVSVFNVLGQKIATLIDRDLTAGTYPLHFETGNLPSGVYFCRMEARHGDGTKTRQTGKMLLSR